MWNPFAKKVPTQVAANPEPKIHTLTPEISLKDLTLPTNVLLRKMKWVTDTGGQTGIIVEFDSSGNALIHYVHEVTGETTRSARIRVSSLRLAKFKEIPAVRRAGLSEQAGAALGYF